MGFFDLFKKDEDEIDYEGEIVEEYEDGYKKVYSDGTTERVKHTSRGDVSYFDGPNGKAKIGPDWHP